MTFSKCTQGLFNHILFEDVLPLLDELKKRNYILGIITNADQSVIKLINTLGLGPYLTVIVTSEGARAEKPDPVIFNAAYDQAGLKAEEILYIGDQYKSDILGAKRVGSDAVLLDRHNLTTESIDCPKISRLDQLLGII